MYEKGISGFSITMAEIIALNVSEAIVFDGELKSEYCPLGRFYWSVVNGEDSDEIQLNALDKLLIKNRSDLKGEIFQLYQDALEFRPKYKAILESEAKWSDADYLSDQFEEYFSE